jgi:hypothetical protein
MSVGPVSLNGVGYAIRPFKGGEWVKREQIEIFAPVVSPGGQQRQERITSYSARTLGPFTGGFGRNRILATDADEPEEYRRFRDATADTRWRTARAPILETDTNQGGLEVIGASVQWRGALWALWTDDTGTDVVAKTLSGTTWGGGGNVNIQTNANEPTSLFPYRQWLVALGAGGAVLTDHWTRYSEDGITWSTPAGGEITAGLLTSDVEVNAFQFDGRLAEIGGELVAAVYHEDRRTITFFSATDMTANPVWTDEAIDIPSNFGVSGIAVYPDIDGADKLYAATDTGVWMIDTAPATWTFRHILPMPFHGDNGIHMTVHDGKLWVPSSRGEDGAFAMVTLEVAGDSRIVTSGLGLDAGDGVVAEMLGSVYWMISAGERLYVAVGGSGASRNGRILCMMKDEQGRYSWHSVRRYDTAAERAEWVDIDGNDICYSVRTGGNVSDVKQLQNGDIDPESGISITRETSGYIDLPYIDGGMPTTPAVWVRVGVDASGLTAGVDGSGVNGTDEYIDVTHGVDNAVRTTTDLGDILSGQLVVDYASGAGADGRNDGLRLVLNRGATNTNTPQLRSVEMDFLKQPGVLDRYIFQVDLEATVALAGNDGHGNVEGVITTLEAARDLGTLPTFMYANLNGGTDIHVKVRDIRWGESIEVEGGDRPTAPSADAQRKGIAVVTVERVIR